VRVQHRRIFPPQCMCLFPGIQLADVRFPPLSSFQIPGLMYLTLAGTNMRTSAKRFCLTGSEFLVAAKKLIVFNMIIGPKDPLLCPLGNSCPLLGLRYRLHGSSIRFFVRKRSHSQFQLPPPTPLDQNWDPSVSVLGGKSPPPVLCSPCCASSHIRFRHSRITSCRVVVSPMYVLSWPALRLLALERSRSDQPNYIP
jgi:hypothetical protein